MAATPEKAETESVRAATIDRLKALPPMPANPTAAKNGPTNAADRSHNNTDATTGKAEAFSPPYLLLDPAAAVLVQKPLCRARRAAPVARRVRTHPSGVP